MSLWGSITFKLPHLLSGLCMYLTYTRIWVLAVLHYVSGSLGYNLYLVPGLFFFDEEIVSFQWDRAASAEHVFTVLYQDCIIARDRDIVINLFDCKHLVSAWSHVSDPVPDRKEIQAGLYHKALSMSGWQSWHKAYSSMSTYWGCCWREGAWWHRKGSFPLSPPRPCLFLTLFLSSMLGI